MKLLNQGERTITFVDNGKTYELTPKKGVEVSEETGKKLKKLFAGEVITFEDVVQNFNAAAADAIKEVEKATSDIADTATPKEEDEAAALAAEAQAKADAEAAASAGNTDGEDAPKTGGIAGLFKRS